MIVIKSDVKCPSCKEILEYCLDHPSFFRCSQCHKEYDAGDYIPPRKCG